jgi:tRNA pseudouridine65 synthase
MTVDLRSHILLVGAKWLIVDKPADLSVHNAQPPQSDLITEIDRLVHQDTNLRQQLNLQKKWTLHPVHRLDAATSGVSLIAFDAQVASELAQAFAERRANKSYVAIAKGVLPVSSAHLEWSWPLTDKSEGRRNPQGTGAKKESLSRVEVCANNRYFSLLRVHLLTGRQHQIRRHAALAKHPLIGDTRYGDPKYQQQIATWYEFTRLALHAEHLNLEWSGGIIDVHAPMPASFAKLIECAIV